MLTLEEKAKYPHLFFKNGKAKKSKCWCLNDGIREFRRLYGRTIIQCGGLRCPYYPLECGRSNIERYEETKRNVKNK